MGKLTHKGWLGLCPVHLGDLDSEAPSVECRHRSLEPWFLVNLWLFGLAATALTTMNPEFVPQWPLRITGTLAQPLDLTEPDDGTRT